MKVAMLSLLVFMIGGSLAHAQAGQPVAPPEPSGEGLGTDCAYENIFVGPSFSARFDHAFPHRRSDYRAVFRSHARQRCCPVSSVRTGKLSDRCPAATL